MWLIVPAITIAGGVVLILARLWKNGRPAWSFNALSLAGLASVAYGVLSLMLHRPFSVEVLQLIGHFKALVAGVAMGILVTLALAGELSLARSRKRQKPDPTD